MECFPEVMHEIASDFNFCETLILQTQRKLVLDILLFIGLLIAIIFTFNYFDEDYYYWAPSFSVVFTIIVVLGIIYDIARIWVAKTLYENKGFYNEETAYKILDYYGKIYEINANFSRKRIKNI